MAKKYLDLIFLSFLSPNIFLLGVFLICVDAETFISVFVVVVAAAAVVVVAAAVVAVVVAAVADAADVVGHKKT